MRKRCRIEALAGVRIWAVAAGGCHCLAVSDAGALYSWGYGGDGRLGHGDEQCQLTPRRVEELTNVRVTAVAAGCGHSLAVSAAGKLYSWEKWRVTPCTVTQLKGIRAVQVHGEVGPRGRLREDIRERHAGAETAGDRGNPRDFKFKAVRKELMTEKTYYRKVLPGDDLDKDLMDQICVRVMVIVPLEQQTLFSLEAFHPSLESLGLVVFAHHHGHKWIGDQRVNAYKLTDKQKPSLSMGRMIDGGCGLRRKEEPHSLLPGTLARCEQQIASLRHQCRRFVRRTRRPPRSHCLAPRSAMSAAAGILSDVQPALNENGKRYVRCVMGLQFRRTACGGMGEHPSGGCSAEACSVHGQRHRCARAVAAWPRL